MYPHGELAGLEVYKAALRQRIAARRVECAVAAAGAVRPLIWLDRAVVLWRKIRPLARLATIPLALLLKRTLLPRAGILTSLLRWTPAIFSAGRVIFSLRRQPQR